MRSKILRELKSAKYISGEEIAKKLGVSRTAIWKHIQSLKSDGYKIETSKKGYSLSSIPDLLLPEELELDSFDFHHFHETNSTNTVAKELAMKGAKEWTVVVAETQKKGRGRLGREWFSPRGGIYFSVILRPGITPGEAQLITLLASIAVAKTMRRLYKLNAKIKWPNDVVIHGKKVCGILAELSAELDVLNFVVVGIGINVNVEGFPEEVKDTATSLKEELKRNVSRVELLKFLLQELRKCYGSFRKNPDEILREWKLLSDTLGRYVEVKSREKTIRGKAIDVDKNGGLLVRTYDSVERVIAGDCIHLRGRDANKL